MYDEVVQKVNAIFQTTDSSHLVEKTEKKIDHNHDKYITTQELNKLAKENCAARLKKAKLATNADIADFVKKTDFDDKLKKKIISK